MAPIPSITASSIMLILSVLEGRIFSQRKDTCGRFTTPHVGPRPIPLCGVSPLWSAPYVEYDVPNM